MLNERNEAILRRAREQALREQQKALAREAGRAIERFITYKIYRRFGAKKWQAWAIADVLLRLDRLERRS